MANLICWICNYNPSYKQYIGTEHLDDDGSKPCLECLIEAGAFDEKDEQPKEEENEF